MDGHEKDATVAQASPTPPKTSGSKASSDDGPARDFEGPVATTNQLPSAETVAEADDYVLLDRDGRSHSFRSLHSGRNVARRVLVVFVRHFFCGNCQEFLRSLSSAVTPEALLQLPVSSFVVVVGCGDAALIDMYVEATRCPFPVYTDPTGALFDRLGMVKTLALGPRPAYMRKSMAKGVLDSIGQGLRHLPSGLALRSGDHRQVGGEFLFEPLDPATPLDEDGPPVARAAADDDKDGRPVEPKRVTWCHRMTNTRDHAEIPELMDILGLDGPDPARLVDQADKEGARRWARAMQLRKGSGVTMADQMRKLSVAEASPPS
ncbi:hypothetical protein CDD83_10122 [Cordyceps sp. RAO-2017]|nr:hypothetical protein CDD83_10122 [Cordyceps sp. RAO-2017]